MDHNPQSHNQLQAALKRAKRLYKMLPLMLYKLLIASLLLSLLLRNSESLQFPSRRTFFTKAATASVIAAACCGNEVANAAIDVSGLRVTESQTQTTPGRAPNQPASGPLAGTSLGFQVAGGPRPESEVRKIDEARYAAVRKATGQGPLFLDGVPREQQPDEIKRKTELMK
jgi:hypothetical protein